MSLCRSEHGSQTDTAHLFVDRLNADLGEDGAPPKPSFFPFLGVSVPGVFATCEEEIRLSSRHTDAVTRR
jgi:hypothetical protein